MSDNTAQEPTMEEILASIRRIISEDDAPAAAEPAKDGAGEPAPEPEPEPEAAPEPVQSFDEGDDDDVLELTEPVAAQAPEPVHALAPEPEPVHEPEPEPMEALGDLEVFSAAPAPKPAAKRAAARPAPEPDDEPVAEGLSSRPTTDLAASAFSALSRTVAMPSEGRTLEDVVRELLRPMLKDWLDQNLHDIVETAVQAEVERISRLRRF
jgi:cell pole-organizing protein PopZ